MKWRSYTILTSFLLVFIFIGARLYQIQIIKGGYYYGRANAEVAALDSERGSRGNIFFTDKNGNDVAAAINKRFPIIYG